MLVPLNVEMAGAPVVCVGAGPVAAAKVVPMARAGAVVTVVAPDIAPELAEVADRHIPRGHQPGDLDVWPRPRLVVAATGVREVDQAVADEAAALGLWCLRIDGRGDVTLPAVIRRGGVVLATTTGAPALSRALRQHLDEVVGEEWGTAADQLADLRGDADIRAALAEVSPDDRRRRWRQAVEQALAGADRPTLAAVLRGMAGRD